MLFPKLTSSLCFTLTPPPWPSPTRGEGIASGQGGNCFGASEGIASGSVMIPWDPNDVSESQKEAAATLGSDRRRKRDRRAYLFGRMSPVSRYRVWNENASLSMCGECRPALGLAKARL